MQCLKAFEIHTSRVLSWPLTDVDLCGFASWAILNRHLKTSTVRTYLSNLSTAHELKGFGRVSCLQPLTKRVLKGAENLDFYNSIAKSSRKVMTLPLLKLLGHEIAESSWSPFNKQVFWTACVTAFFGSFRFGEILAPSEWAYNKHETLLWSDVDITEDSVLIHVKISKNRTQGGEHIDLFPFSSHNCCPVKCLTRLQRMCMAKTDGKLADGEPVFRFDSGKLLTSEKLNTTLELLLRPHLGDQARDIQGHSFRAAIPSAMANNPNLASDEEIKSWGRWNSGSFKLYTRLRQNQKRSIFDKITAILNL
jgi:hypothetical protein